MEVPDNMKKALFVGSIVVFSMFVPELFSGNLRPSGRSSRMLQAAS